MLFRFNTIDQKDEATAESWKKDPEGTFVESEVTVRAKDVMLIETGVTVLEADRGIDFGTVATCEVEVRVGPKRRHRFRIYRATEPYDVLIARWDEAIRGTRLLPAR